MLFACVHMHLLHVSATACVQRNFHCDANASRVMLAACAGRIAAGPLPNPLLPSPLLLKTSAPRMTDGAGRNAAWSPLPRFLQKNHAVQRTRDPNKGFGGVRERKNNAVDNYMHVCLFVFARNLILSVMLYFYTSNLNMRFFSLLNHL